jgi:hypothetical protein
LEYPYCYDKKSLYLFASAKFTIYCQQILGMKPCFSCSDLLLTLNRERFYLHHDFKIDQYI